MSVLGPVLRLFQSYLGAETIHRAGAQHVLNAEYFQRIDALNYTMFHDDGQHVEGLEEADVVLVGVSRTSKTPTSIYLANRGVKTGNVPLVPGVPLPPQVEKLTRPLVVGLYASPERIVQIRENRLLGLKAHRDDDQYIDKTAVAEEVAFSRRLCAKHNWPSIDVTRRSIEETAAAVMKLLAERRRNPVEVRDIMPLWLARQPLVLASKSDVRGKMLAAAGLRFEIRPAQIDERAVEAKAGVADAARGRPAAGARQGRGGGDDAVPASWCSAPIRRWRAAPPASASRPTAPPRASSCGPCAGERTNCIPRSRWCSDGTVLFDCVDTARLTMRDFSDRFLDDYLDMAGDVGAEQRRRLSARRHRHSSVRARRGRLFHHSRPAAVAAARLSARATVLWTASA